MVDQLLSDSPDGDPEVLHGISVLRSPDLAEQVFVESEGAQVNLSYGLVPMGICAWTPFGLLFSVDVGFKVAKQSTGSLQMGALAAVPLTVLLTGLTAAFTWLFVG